MADAAIRRVAILLDSLDRTAAERLMSSMPASRAIRVRETLATLKDVDPLERKMAIADFMQKSHAPEPSRVATPSDFVPRQTHSAAQTPAISQPEISSAQVAQEASSRDDNNATTRLDFLQRVSITELCLVLANENPQAIAVVLANLNPKQSANLLRSLPAQLRSQAIARLARLGEIPEHVIEQIEAHLQSRLASHLQADENPSNERSQANEGFSETFVSILRNLENEERGEVLSDLAIGNPDLLAMLPETIDAMGEAQQKQHVKGNVVSHAAPEPAEPAAEIERDLASEALLKRQVPPINFDPIEALPSESLCHVLSLVEPRVAVLSLFGMKSRTVNRLLALLPRMHAQDVRSRLNHPGKVDFADIKEAQAIVARMAYELAESGELPHLKVPQSYATKLRFAA